MKKVIILGFIVLALVVIALILGGCSYTSRIVFDATGRAATLYSNTKTSAKINMKEQTAEINQIGETWLQKLQKSLPQNVEVAK